MKLALASSRRIPNEVLVADALPAPPTDAAEQASPTSGVRLLGRRRPITGFVAEGSRVRPLDADFDFDEIPSWCFEGPDSSA